jgi:hypothetical protein
VPGFAHREGRTIDFVSRTRWQSNSETGNEARVDDTDQGERLGGVHAVLYPPAIAALKQGEGEGGGFGIKDGIKQAGRKGKVLVRQRFIAGLDPSRPSHYKLYYSPLTRQDFAWCHL